MSRLPRARRRLLVVAWAMLAFGLAVRAFAAGMLHEQAGAAAPWQSIRVDLNHATVPELMAVPGIGLVRAEAIVLSRVRFGPFARVEDLGRVDGIGAQTVSRIGPFVCVGDDMRR
ncbi:MAG TPA: helix-hairpin-helix domain-containing protein [Planctomycetota bacterium]|nr:helix-hairpin-helix domain-containing protein [Planctomycetota bacterium]